MLSSYTYIENVHTYDAPIDEFARIAGEEISPIAEDDVMTIAERFRKEAKIEIVQKLLKETKDMQLVARVTELSLSELEKIKEKLH